MSLHRTAEVEEGYQAHEGFDDAEELKGGRKPQEGKTKKRKQRPGKKKDDSDSDGDEDMAAAESTMLSPSRAPSKAKGAAQNTGGADDEPELAIVYAPGGSLPRLSQLVNKVIEVRIPSKFLTLRNKEVQRTQLWGTDVYTDDSDAVAILMHTGRMILRNSPPSGCIGVSAFFRVLPVPTKPVFTATVRYQIKSRSWNAGYTRHCLQLLRSEKIEKGNMFAVKARGPGAPADSKEAKKDAKPPQVPEGKVLRMLEKPSSYRLFAPKINKRKMTPDVPIVFNSNFEPSLKYTLDLVKDVGMNEDEWTSTRLKKEVMYFESPATQQPIVRYELAREAAVGAGKYDQYRWSQLLSVPPLVARPDLFENKGESKTDAVRETVKGGGVKRRKVEVPAAAAPARAPLEASAVKVLAAGLDWEHIEWAPNALRIRGKDYAVHCVQFKPIA